MVRLVGRDWAEIKILAVGVVELTDSGQFAAITELSSASRLLDAQQFQIATLGERHCGIERAGQVVAINDSAPWIQGWVRLSVPGRRPHLAPMRPSAWSSWDSAKGQPPPDAMRAWFATMQHRLKHEDMASILAEVMAVAAVHPDPLAAHDHWPIS